MECTVTSAVTKEATTRTQGIRTYTATVTIDGKTYTSTKTETIPKIDDGGLGSIITVFVNVIRNVVNNIINSFLSIFRLR